MDQRSKQIPFIDVAVQDSVRDAMLDSNAAVLFDPSLESVIWAKQSAAKLFGYESLGAFLDAGLTPFATTLRQIENVVARDPASPQSMMLRISAGINSALVPAKVETIDIQDHGAKFVLLTINAGGRASADNVYADAIAGLEEDGAAAAICGENGAVLACGPLFDALDVPESDLAELTREIENEDDRLIKRLLQRTDGRSSIAVGFGRLSEDPARNLLVGMEVEEIAAEETVEAAPPAPIAIETSEDVFEAANEADSSDPEVEEPDQMDTEVEPLPKSEPFKIDRSQRPIRFVWKTNAKHEFLEVSDEFGGAVGSKAANILGSKMSDVLAALNIDPTGSIGNAMQRGDTWSGKTVLWPIENTDLRVPVDLAALPYHDRNRNFEGYRGFGIIRMADAVVDPEALGLKLPKIAQDAPASEADEIEAEDQADNTHHTELEDDPFNGEPPALEVAPLQPMRRRSDVDKVVPLDEVRQSRQNPGALDESDAATFQKIADTLNGSAAPSEAQDDDVEGETTEAEEVVSAETETFAETASIDEPEDRSDDEAEDVADLEPSSEDATDVSAEHDEDQSPALDGYEARSIAQEAGLGPDALNALPLPLLVVRGEEALFGNHAFAQMTGYETIDALNANGLSNLFGDDESPLDHAEGDDDSRPLAIVRANGEAISARAHLQTVPWMGITGLMFAFDPLSGTDSGDDQSMQVAEAASERESAAFSEIAEMRAILDTATDGVVILSDSGTIRSINGSASALFGYSEHEIEGKSFSILFATESQRAAMDYLGGFSDNAVASLLNEGRELLARERNGGFLPVFMTIGRLPTSNGFCAVLRDITPWKQTEQALETAKLAAEEASNTKSEFLAKISHEIRTPLNAIIGFSELMSEERFGPVGNPRYKDYLIDINKSGRHVLDLVNDLLDISKIEAGQQELEFEGVFLNEAVADAVAMVQPQANRNRIIVRSSLESNLPSVVADARSIKQIVLNLLSNAIRFTHSGGQVVISTNYTHDGSVVMRIRDTGIGMSQREIETALKPFEQVASREQEMSDGTGLGLPLTKALVQANRAEFYISSEPGRGTSVEVVFPPARVLAD